MRPGRRGPVHLDCYEAALRLLLQPLHVSLYVCELLLRCCGP